MYSASTSAASSVCIYFLVPHPFQRRYRKLKRLHVLLLPLVPIPGKITTVFRPLLRAFFVFGKYLLCSFNGHFVSPAFPGYPSNLHQFALQIPS